MEEEILETIFITLSEALIARLIQLINNDRIPLYEFANGIITPCNLNPHPLEQPINCRVKADFEITAGHVPVRKDSQHKIDVLVETAVGFYAMEVKAGRRGPVESPSRFVTAASKKEAAISDIKTGKKKARVTKVLTGCMTSIISHNNPPNFAIKIQTNNNQHAQLQNSWFLCLRNFTQWNGKRIDNPVLFQNCKILFIDQIAQLARRETFDEALRTVFPLCNCRLFSDQMWRLATAVQNPNR